LFFTEIEIKAQDSVGERGFFYIEAAQTNIWTSFSKNQICGVPLLSHVVRVQTENTIKAVGAGITFGRQFNKWHDVRFEVGVAQDRRAEFSGVAHSYGGGYFVTSRTFTYKATLIPTTATYNFTAPIYKDRIFFGVGASVGASCAKLKGVAWDIGRGFVDIKTNHWDFLCGLNASLRVKITDSLYARLTFNYFNSSNLGNPKLLSISIGWKL
jgi:hypothetical protein